MPTDWYLMQSPHNQVSGYESEAFIDFAQEGFYEALDSEIGVDVELCNYDTSERVHMRAIVQGNTKDSKLNTLSRQFLFPIGTCKSGMYVYYKGRYWLIVGLVDDNKMYEKAICSICNYKLAWVNRSGKVVQRWANITSASQYNNGETSTKFYYIRTDQLMVLTPDDEECLMLDSGKRMVIDRRCEVYERSLIDVQDKDTSKPISVYQITRSDSVLFDYQDSGYFAFMAYQEEQRDTDGYYVVDGEGYWLCDEPKREHEISLLSCEIESESDVIYAQVDASIFTAKFLDADSNEIDVAPIWEVNAPFIDKLTISYADNSILISTDDVNCIGKSFTLSLCADGYDKATKTVFIRAFI